MVVISFFPYCIQYKTETTALGICYWSRNGFFKCQKNLWFISEKLRENLEKFDKWSTEGQHLIGFLWHCGSVIETFV